MASLQEEPRSADENAVRSWKRPGRGTVAALATAFVAVLVARHDYWNWRDTRPLLLGFIPVGLWWQMLVSLGASGFMWLMVRFAWPGWLEEEAAAAEQRRGAGPADRVT